MDSDIEVSKNAIISFLLYNYTSAISKFSFKIEFIFIQKRVYAAISLDPCVCESKSSSQLNNVLVILDRLSIQFFFYVCYLLPLQ